MTTPEPDNGNGNGNVMVVRLSMRQITAVLSAVGLVPIAMVAMNSPVLRGPAPTVAQVLNDNADFRELCVNSARTAEDVKILLADNKALWQRTNDHQNTIASLVNQAANHEERIKRVEAKTP